MGLTLFHIEDISSHHPVGGGFPSESPVAHTVGMSVAGRIDKVEWIAG